MMSGTYHLMVANTSCNKAAEIVYEADYILGDANGDQVVDANDVTDLLRHVVRIEEIKNETFLKAADVDRSGEVDALDVTKLLRYVVRIDSTL